MKTSWDSVAALMRELSAEEQLALVDSDNRPAIKQFLLGLHPVLAPAGTIKVRPATNIVASDFFQVNIEKDALVKISHPGDNFKKWFLQPSVRKEVVFGDGPYRTPGVQKEVAETTLCYHPLNRRLADGPIINQLGGEAMVEITLAEFIACLQQQGSGEKGALLTNGYYAIFYVRDTSGVLRVVCVNWAGVWRMDAHSVERSYEWFAGNRVFSRDS